MIEPTEPTGIGFVLIAALGGGGLALVHLLALGWAVRRLETDDRGKARLLATGVARIAFVVAGFWLIANGDPSKLVASLAGFVVTRQLVVSRISAIVDAPAIARDGP